MKKSESKEEKQKEKVTGKSEFKTTSVSSEGKSKIPRKKVLLRVLLVQTKNLQLQTVPIHQINQKKML